MRVFILATVLATTGTAPALAQKVNSGNSSPYTVTNVDKNGVPISIRDNRSGADINPRTAPKIKRFGEQPAKPAPSVPASPTAIINNQTFTVPSSVTAEQARGVPKPVTTRATSTLIRQVTGGSKPTKPTPSQVAANLFAQPKGAATAPQLKPPTTASTTPPKPIVTRRQSGTRF